MEVKHLSTSLISGWSLCPLRAWSSYAARNTHGNDYSFSQPTEFGNVVHDTMEELHRLAQHTDEIPHPIDVFDDFWRKRKCTDLDYHILGRENIESFLDRSFKQRDGTTIAQELHFLLDVSIGRAWDLTDMWGDDIDSLIEDVLEADGVPIISKIDRLDYNDEANRYTVTDYKTNAQPFTRDEIDNSKQLGIYDMAVRALFRKGEDIEVVCVYDMLRHGRFPVVFDDQKRGDLQVFLVNLWHQIDQAETVYPRLNQYCHVCEIRGNCPAYQDVLEQEIQPILTDDTDLVGLVESFEQMKSRIKILQNRVEEMGSMLSTRVVMAEGEPVEVGDKMIYLQPNPRYEYPVDDIFALLERKKATALLPQIVNISNKALQRAMKQVDFADEIEALKTKGYNKSSLKIKSTSPSPEETEDE